MLQHVVVGDHDVILHVRTSAASCRPARALEYKDTHGFVAQHLTCPVSTRNFLTERNLCVKVSTIDPASSKVLTSLFLNSSCMLLSFAPSLPYSRVLQSLRASVHMKRSKSRRRSRTTKRCLCDKSFTVCGNR
jgi:hypothetical protein